MADAILYGVTKNIIVSSGSAALQQIGAIWGVKDELEKMKNTVSAIQAVLLDAEEKQVKNHHVKYWLMKLREVVFDADDLLSEFDTHVLRQNVMGGDKMAKKVRIFFSRSNQVVFSLNMACKIKAMRERLNDIANDIKFFQLIERPLETQAVTRERETHSFVCKEEVIGRKEDGKTIIDLLKDIDVKDNVSFICIMGIGGLGKTTLAQYVYNDKNVEDYFELKMWVCVSEDFDVKIIVEKIIESATKTKPENLGMDPLQKELREHLDKKKYLLVLDDVWNEDEEKWCNLKRLLMGGAKGSKVVITTRTKLVAEITSTIKPPYVLSGLPKDKSWILLKRMAFGEGQDNTDPDLETIGMDIVEKCKGVPLAIKTIGRVLYFKTTKAEWLDIKNNELTNITQPANGILPILKLSYNHLSPDLKCCFAYCSLFPKDYLFDKLELIQLWIAQGFIQSLEKNKQSEDIANTYFMDLCWRSFFQEAEEYEGMDMKFKMHDLIHDLAHSVSRSECALIDSNANNISEKVRHLSFSFGNISFSRENLNTLVKANKIRTFILACNSQVNYGEIVEESILKPLISSFGYLLALDLHDLEMKTLPNTIGKLMHLKYLNLSYNDIEVLPSSITKLVNLQTLNLSSCENLRELPIDTQKLVSLRHLCINGCMNLTHMPCGLGKLTSLQTLPLFVVSKGPIGSSKHCGGLVELNKLNDLSGKVVIINLAWVKDATSEFKAANLKEKQHLSNLELCWNSEGDDGADACDDENSMDSLQPHRSLKSLVVDGYMRVRVSSWLSFLTSLVQLYVFDCSKCQYLPPLYQLPSLQELRILKMDGLEYMTDGDMNDEISASLASPSTFFPSLQTLILYNCPNLKGWWRRDKGNEATISSSSTNHYHQHIPLPSFPRLSYFRFEYCHKMTWMPLFPNLKEKLSVKNSSLKALGETIEMKMMNTTSSFPSSSSSSSSSFSPPLSKLKLLCLSRMQDLESLPEEWLKNLTSLERLEISDCPNLTSLPQGTSDLTSLQTLLIRYCPQLQQRCVKKKGEDWAKISHIPNLKIYH